MKQYISILGYFGLFVFFMAGNIVFFYSFGKVHSVIPFILIMLFTLAIAVITGMALYQTYKHRHDEKSW